MNELNKGLNISMKGAGARRALADFRRQAKTWGVAVPPVEPFVFDFGLGEYENEQE
jgi:hypothetical protein